MGKNLPMECYSGDPIEIFRFGTVYLQDLDQERFRIYTLHARLIGNEPLLHKTDDVQMS